MMQDNIINYYLLCSVRLGTKRHMINELPPESIDVIFSKKEQELFLRKLDGVYIINETVIGGSDEDDGPIVVI